MAAVVSLYQKHIPRLQQWSKLIVKVGSAQVFLQIIGVLSGILIIHQLTTNEYALYTLANTMVGTITILADGGISLAVMAEGGRIYQDKEKLGAVLITGLQLRRIFGLLTLVVVIPVLFYLLYTHQAKLPFAILTTLAIIPAFFAALSDSLLEVVPKLHQDIDPLQKNQINAGLGRLVMISASLFFFPFAFIAILMNGIPRWWANIKLKKIAAKYADLSQAPDMAVRKNILTIVKRTLPEMIYYCVSGQITIWLLSIFGTTNNIAQIGAISRLSSLVGLFTTLISILIIPRFSRFSGSPAALLKRFLGIFMVVSALGAGIVLFSYLFSSQLLWILGKKYYGLNYYLVLNFAASAVTLIASTLFLLYSSKGWIINPVFLIPLNVALLALGIFLFNLSTLQGVLYLNIYIAFTQLLTHLVFALFKISKLKAAA